MSEVVRSPVPLAYLELVTRALLVRIVARHEAQLAAHGFSVAALAATEQMDRTRVEALWRLLAATPADLLALHDELTAIADVGREAGHERLLASDRDGVLDHDLGPEDLAAIAFLDHRALFDAARPQTPAAQTRRFATFPSKTPKPLPEEASRREAFLRLMADALEARGRTRVFKMHEHRIANERHMELVYGRLTATRDVVGKVNGAHDVTAQVTDRSTERAFAIFHDDTMALDVAGPDWIKELVRRAFGEAYFDAASHFEGDEMLTLEPLRELAGALATHHVPGLKSVTLQEVWIDFRGAGWLAAGARNDCMAGPPGAYVLRALGDDATPVEATFLLATTAKTRPVKLVIVSPRKLDFDRRNPRVVRIVRDWIVAAGYMRVPEHLRALEDEARDSAESDAPEERSV